MRVYSEQEVSQIIERATERQARQRPAPETGLTLDDLERIGAEVGIDAASLRAAAAEVDAAGGATQRRSRSAAHLYVERWVPGAAHRGAWDDIVAELQNRFGKAGLAVDDAHERPRPGAWSRWAATANGPTPTGSAWRRACS